MDCCACDVRWEDGSASTQQYHAHERARDESDKGLTVAVKEIDIPSTSSPQALSSSLHIVMVTRLRPRIDRSCDVTIKIRYDLCDLDVDTPPSP
jgi:hypothetical protein